MTSSCSRGGLDCLPGKISSSKLLSSLGAGCPGERLNLHTRSFLKGTQMLCLGAWLSSGLCGAGLMVGLDNLKGLYPPKQFYGSKIVQVKTPSEPSVNVKNNCHMGFRLQATLLRVFTPLQARHFSDRIRCDIPALKLLHHINQAQAEGVILLKTVLSECSVLRLGKASASKSC